MPVAENRIAYVCPNYHPQQASEDVLAGILRQLWAQKQSDKLLTLPEQAPGLYKTRPSVDEVFSILIRQMAEHSTVSILIDEAHKFVPEVWKALSEKITLLSSVKELQKTQGRVMVMSRDPQSSFPNAQSIEVVPTKEAIIRFVKRRIRLGVSFDFQLSNLVRQDPEMQKEIIDNVLGKMQGSFRWANHTWTVSGTP
ncbi:MAG: hypothetical protein L6R41_004000 [Letrouitia leprolyta]|nr:MAG: hypothetical protein L6R41_004000 [Letrouitia leprolyta]